MSTDGDDSKFNADIAAFMEDLVKPMDYTAYEASIKATEEFKKYCRDGNVTAISTMIAAGRIVDYRTDNLDYACAGGYTTIVELLLSSGFRSYSSLDAACAAGHEAVVELLLNADANPDSGLYAACRAGNRSMVDRLITAGASKWNDGLKGGCAGGHRPIVDLMLSFGADNVRDGMIAACETGHMSIIDLMVSKGADDWTYGLLAACSGNQTTIVKMMINSGAAIVTDESLNCNGESAFREAYRNRNSEIMSILLRYESVVKFESLDAADDPDFWLHLLSVDGVVTRDSMAAVRNIRTVFDRADQLTMAAYDGLTDVGFPAVLQTMIVGYVINSF